MFLVLAYHHIVDWQPEKKTNMAVPVKHFADQMQFLANEYCDNILPNFDHVEDNKFSIALTFDDGYRNFLDLAFPVLEDLKIPATLFMPTVKIGVNEFSDEQDQKVSYLTHDDLSYLSGTGLVDIQSHGDQHIKLGDEGRQTQEADIEKSIAVLSGANLNRPRHFCYPYGSFNEETLGLLEKKGFKTACTTITGVNDRPVSDLLRIKRVPVHSLMDGKAFSQTVKHYLGEYHV